MRLYQRVVWCASRMAANGDWQWFYRLECNCEGVKLKQRATGDQIKPAPVRVFCRRHPYPGHLPKTVPPPRSGS